MTFYEIERQNSKPRSSFGHYSNLPSYLNNFSPSLFSKIRFQRTGKKKTVLINESSFSNTRWYSPTARICSMWASTLSCLKSMPQAGNVGVCQTSDICNPQRSGLYQLQHIPFLSRCIVFMRLCGNAWLKWTCGIKLYCLDFRDAFFVYLAMDFTFNCQCHL